VTAPATSVVRKASLFYFVFVMYSYTTGGPFGLEEQVTTSGPGMTLLYHLILPFFWCIPVSLASAELTTAMPVEGGLCLGPVGPGCVYGDRLCDCVGGHWRCGVCPVNMPTNTAACSIPASCSYPTSFCYCDGATWSCS